MTPVQPPKKWFTSLNSAISADFNGKKYESFNTSENISKDPDLIINKSLLTNLSYLSYYTFASSLCKEPY